jgi:hypothetical protein
VSPKRVALASACLGVPCYGVLHPPHRSRPCNVTIVKAGLRASVGRAGCKVRLAARDHRQGMDQRSRCHWRAQLSIEAAVRTPARQHRQPSTSDARDVELRRTSKAKLRAGAAVLTVIKRLETQVLCGTPIIRTSVAIITVATGPVTAKSFTCIGRITIVLLGIALSPQSLI